MTVRVVREEEPRERAIGDGRREVAQLHQAIEPKLAHAIEVRLGHPGPGHDVGQQSQRLVAEAGQRE